MKSFVCFLFAFSMVAIGCNEIKDFLPAKGGDDSEESAPNTNEEPAPNTNEEVDEDLCDVEPYSDTKKRYDDIVSYANIYLGNHYNGAYKKWNGTAISGETCTVEWELGSTLPCSGGSCATVFKSTVIIKSGDTTEKISFTPGSYSQETGNWEFRAAPRKIETNEHNDVLTSVISNNCMKKEIVIEKKSNNEVLAINLSYTENTINKFSMSCSKLKVDEVCKLDQYTEPSSDTHLITKNFLKMNDSDYQSITYKGTTDDNKDCTLYIDNGQQFHPPSDSVIIRYDLEEYEYPLKFTYSAAEDLDVKHYKSNYLATVTGSILSIKTDIPDFNSSSRYGICKSSQFTAEQDPSSQDLIRVSGTINDGTTESVFSCSNLVKQN